MQTQTATVKALFSEVTPSHDLFPSLRCSSAHAPHPLSMQWGNPRVSFWDEDLLVDSIAHIYLLAKERKPKQLWVLNK